VKGGFHRVFDDRPIKWPIAKKIKNPIQTWTQNLINMDLQEGMVIKGV
jgi:hypothetical protein